MNRRLAACAIALLAAGCATLPQPGDAVDWPVRRSQLQALEHWTLNGRIAVAAGAEGFSGGLTWRQDGAQAAIEMRGPTGGRALSIAVNGEEFSVTDGAGARVDGEDAQRLLADRLGTALPIGQLRYWLVGAPAPAPAAPHQETLGAEQRLLQLEQAGWRISYTGYRSVGDQALPVRMELTTDNLRLRLAVADWRLTR